MVPAASISYDPNSDNYATMASKGSGSYSVTRGVLFNLAC